MKFPAFIVQCSVLLLTAGICRSDVPLEVSLVSEVGSIQPGRAFFVGLHLHHGTDYHSYWKFPGIVGVPTAIQWRLPRGFEAGDLEWPAPESVLMFKIRAQGFERDVTLPVKITPPASLKAGDTVTLEGKSSWMACARTCHPGFTDVSITLPVRNEEPAPDKKWHVMFEQERGRVAKTSDAWTATSTEHGHTVTLTLVPSAVGARKIASDQAAAKIIFFTEDGWIDSDKPQIVRLNADGSLTIILQKSEIYLGKEPPKTLVGIVQNADGWCAEAPLTSMRIAPLLKR